MVAAVGYWKTTTQGPVYNPRCRRSRTIKKHATQEIQHRNQKNCCQRGIELCSQFRSVPRPGNAESRRSCYEKATVDSRERRPLEEWWGGSCYLLVEATIGWAQESCYREC